MNLSDTEGNKASGSVVSSSATTRLSGPWLIVARAVWLVPVVPSIGLFVVSLPAYYQQLQRGCVDPMTCSVAGALPVQVLHTAGFPASGYATLLIIFFVLIEATCYGVGFLLFWRRSDDWLALLAAFALVMFNGALALPSPVLDLPISLVSFLGNASILVFFLLFPNGRLVPRWMGLILLLIIIYTFLNNLPSKGSPYDTNWPVWLYLLVNLALYGAMIFSQIYRYRRVSTPVQRQQTKWVVLGATTAVGFYIGLLTLSLFSSSFDNTLFWNEVWSLLLPVALLLIPLSIGFSILRYRLYDIDVLINRTLAAFSATLRNEVDLTQLSEHLMAVVEETMQPAHVSLWVRPTSPRERTEYQPVMGHEQSVD